MNPPRPPLFPSSSGVPLRGMETTQPSPMPSASVTSVPTVAFSPSKGSHSASPSTNASFACLAPSRRSEEHTSELQSLMRISYAVFCLKKKKQPVYREHYYTRVNLTYYITHI